MTTDTTAARDQRARERALSAQAYRVGFNDGCDGDFNPEACIARMGDPVLMTAADEAASQPREGGAEDRFWLIVREPGMVPDRKGPWPHRDTARVLREFIAARPRAFLDVLTVDEDGTPWVEHGPQALQMADGRSMSVGSKHNARVRAAAEDALAALPPATKATAPQDGVRALEEVRHAADAIIGDLGQIDSDGFYNGTVHRSDVEHLEQCLAALVSPSDTAGDDAEGLTSGEAYRPDAIRMKEAIESAVTVLRGSTWGDEHDTEGRLLVAAQLEEAIDGTYAKVDEEILYDREGPR